jgi:hypothetical protein
MPLTWDFVDKCENHELGGEVEKGLLRRTLYLWLRFENILLAPKFKYFISFASLIRQFSCCRGR